MNEYAFKFSPSLLDAFQTYKDASTLYERFFGSSEEPSQTCDEFERQKFQELIDKINRVPFESEAADKGSCFNEIIDCLVLNTRSTREDIEVSSKEGFVERHVEGSIDPWDGKVTYADVEDELIQMPHIEAKKGDNVFRFDIGFCKDVAQYFNGSLCQVYVEAPIETRFGKVLLYGFPDYIKPSVVYDLKTTSKYEFGKYSKYWQQHVYPYALIESGKCTDIAAFEFTVFQMKGGNSKSPVISGDMYKEVYTYSHTRTKAMLKDICEQFSEFLINNRNLIEDEKIFGGEKKVA